MSIHNRTEWFYGERIGKVAKELYEAGYAFDYVSPRMVKAGWAKKYAAVVDPDVFFNAETQGRREALLKGVRKMPFDAKSGLLTTRWRKGAETAYFVVNTGTVARVVAADFEFAAADPMSGEVASAKEATVEAGHSLFIAASGLDSLSLKVKAPPAVHPSRRIVSIQGPWNVSPICGGPAMPAPRTLDALVGWETFDEFFSGTMLYKTTFDLDHDCPSLLSLGDVREIARVRLNGRDLGVKFMPPYDFAIPAGAAKEKGNVLEVEVTNLGANRLRWNDVNKVDWKYFSDINMVGLDYKKLDASKWKPLRSGLLGPVGLCGQK